MNLTSDELYKVNERLTSLNNKNNRCDNFDVIFLGLPENLSNFLGRQIKTIDRPEFTFQPTETSFRRNTYKDKGRLTFQPITAIFHDDENAVTSALLYTQLFRQINKHSDLLGEDAGTKDMTRDYKFGIEMRFYNSSQEESEAVLLTGCFLASINHIQPDRTDDSETELTVVIEFDNVSVKLFDEFVRVV